MGTDQVARASANRRNAPQFRTALRKRMANLLHRQETRFTQSIRNPKRKQKLRHSRATQSVDFLLTKIDHTLIGPCKRQDLSAHCGMLGRLTKVPQGARHAVQLWNFREGFFALCYARSC